jgi:hypothetical protein
MTFPVPREGSVAFFQKEVVASAARTTSGSTGTINIGHPATGMVVEIDVTAVAGTSPTLTVSLEDTFDGANWNKVVDLNSAAITATGRTVKRLDVTGLPFTNTTRLSWTLGGTAPSFTFSVNAFFARA